MRQSLANKINYINKKKLTSSTIGDLPNNEILISKNVDEVSNTNVDFIKIGVYEKGYINTLSKIRSCKMLIAVFFADKFLPTKKDIETLKNSGFKGANIVLINGYHFLLRNSINFFIAFAL